MIISTKRRYAYIGIPRTGSKSMNQWLMEHFDGVWYGGHHDFATVPDGAKNFLIFTTVRNPYDRAVSGHFGVHWEKDKPSEELRVLVPPPDAESMARSIERATSSDNRYPGYREIIATAGVHLALYAERLPECLTMLPFTDASMPAFPHVLERGIRPPGEFRDFFNEAFEEHIWEITKDDFRLFDYERHNSRLPDSAPDGRWLRESPTWRLDALSGACRTMWEIAEGSGPLSQDDRKRLREVCRSQAEIHPSAALRKRFDAAADDVALDREAVSALATFTVKEALRK
jgi:hypothetical protein